MGAGSPGLVEGTGGSGEDYMVLRSTASEPEKKSSRRKKERIPQAPPNVWLWVCICFCQVLDEVSLMTIGLGTNL
ncbi:homeobox protein MOX-1-like protein [Cricetulus griseus]|nr:homeobox protein MOX-1-like protein [Cricetulus griseus]